MIRHRQQSSRGYRLPLWVSHSYLRVLPVPFSRIRETTRCRTDSSGRGGFALAEAELQSACRSWEKVLGQNSTYYVRALNYLVQVQWQLGELRQAEALQKRALFLATGGSLPAEMAHALMNKTRIELREALTMMLSGTQGSL